MMNEFLCGLYTKIGNGEDMNRLFDTTIDVNIRQFYVLAMGACVGNLAGFIGNACIYGFSMPTFFCGICALLIIVGSLVGIFARHPKRACYFIVMLTTFVEFPVLYYIYQHGTIVYMVLSIVSIATFIPAIHAWVFALMAFIGDMIVILMVHFYPPDIEQVTDQEMFQSVICSFTIVFICVYMITILLKIQQEKQEKELKILSEQMKVLADHDTLTGLYNRRYLNRYLEQLIADGTENFHAVLMDLDFFKKINDCYGHLFGDEVLLKFSQIMQEQIKDKGIVSRFGGEEFMIIFPKTPIEEIQGILQEIHTDYREYSQEKKGRDFTFSSGVASYEKGMEISALYSLADEKLYQAKEKRNRDVYC